MKTYNDIINILTDVYKKDELKVLLKEYKNRRDNLWKSMKKISMNSKGYDYFDGARMAYNQVIEDLEKLLK